MVQRKQAYYNLHYGLYHVLHDLAVSVYLSCKQTLTWAGRFDPCGHMEVTHVRRTIASVVRWGNVF